MLDDVSLVAVGIAAGLPPRAAYLIDSGFQLVSLIAMGAVIGGRR